MSAVYAIEKTVGGHPWDGKGEYALVHIWSENETTHRIVCLHWESLGYHCWIDGEREGKPAACYFKLIGEPSPEDEDRWE